MEILPAKKVRYQSSSWLNKDSLPLLQKTRQKQTNKAFKENGQKGVVDACRDSICFLPRLEVIVKLDFFVNNAHKK